MCLLSLFEQDTPVLLLFGPEILFGRNFSTGNVHHLECSLAVRRWQEFGSQVYIVLRSPRFAFLINRSSEAEWKISVESDGRG